MKTMHRPILFGLAVLATATAIASATEEKKVEAEVTAEEIALENQTLDQLRTSGSDLSKPHQIEFYLYLPSKADAEAAAAVLRPWGTP